MALVKPRYITHYLPLFDNSTNKDGMLIDRRDQVVEGAAIFRREGIVVLGHEGFGFTRPIKDVRFGGGCVANRNVADQILEIKSPIGEVFRYRYVHRDKNWYRLVLVERAPNRVMHGVHAVREEVEDHGLILGVVFGTFRVVIAFVLYLVSWALFIGFLGLVGFVTQHLICRGYGHLGLEHVRKMIFLTWLLEATVVGLLYLADLAYGKGGWFFRRVLPLVFLLGVFTVAYMLFPSPQVLFQTLRDFQYLDVSHFQ